MNHEKRLRDLEKVWPKAELPATRPPIPWERLSDQDRADFADLNVVWRAVDVPAGLDPRAEARARLDALTDDQVERLAQLAEKVQQLTREEQPACWR